MFNNISWKDYIIVVAITLIVYYVFVGLRYYTVELKGLLSQKSKRQKPEINTAALDVDPVNLVGVSSLQNKDDFDLERSEDEEFEEVEQLTSRLKEAIQKIFEKRHVSEQLKYFICILLHEYPALKTSLFRSSVNEFVVSECEKYGSATLTEEEVDLLWNQAG